MKIVILDGRGLNPGDLSWGGFEAIGQVTVYDRTPVDDEDEIVRRINPTLPVFHHGLADTLLYSRLQRISQSKSL